MFTKIKRMLVISSSSLVLLFSVAAPVAVSAAASAGSGSGCGNTGTSVARGASQAIPNNGGGDINCDSEDGNLSGLGTIARNVVNLFSFVIGAIAVIMIIYGGFRYITSGGSSDGVSAAKSTLIYAIIGLIVVALAQLIVQFVLTQSSNATTAA